MADRRRQVVLLLGSRFDGLYRPGGALSSRSGFAPGASRPCPDCGQSESPGWLVDRFGRRSPCARCGGASDPSGKRGEWLKRDGGAGVIAFDRMDVLELPVGSEATFATARPRATIRCDACGGDGAHGNGQRCRVCGGLGRRDLHAFELVLGSVEEGGEDPLLASITRRDEAGSYEALDRALHELAQSGVGRRARRLLDDVYLAPATRTLDELSPTEAALVGRAVGFLERRMPAEIRVPTQVTANARELRAHRGRVHGRRVEGSAGPAVERRNGEIRKLVRAGKPTQWVAGEYGLSVRRVNQIAEGDPGWSS